MARLAVEVSGGEREYRVDRRQGVCYRHDRSWPIQAGGEL
jgi:hypothetical protein